MLKYKILWWRFKDLFSKRSKFRKLERKVDYLDHKLTAFVLYVEEMLQKND
jgi:hypothetical protein